LIKVNEVIYVGGPSTCRAVAGRMAMRRLTLVAVSKLAEGEDIQEICRLDASGKGVTRVEDLRL